MGKKLLQVNSFSYFLYEDKPESIKNNEMFGNHIFNENSLKINQFLI